MGFFKQKWFGNCKKSTPKEKSKKAAPTSSFWYRGDDLFDDIETKDDKEKGSNKLYKLYWVLKQRFGIYSLRLFGSVARGEHQAGSDVDVCVEMEPNLYRLISLKQRLEALLKCPVDVVRVNRNMSPFLKSEIEKDGVYVIS